MQLSLRDRKDTGCRTRRRLQAKALDEYIKVHAYEGTPHFMVHVDRLLGTLLQRRSAYWRSVLHAAILTSSRSKRSLVLFAKCADPSTILEGVLRYTICVQLAVHVATATCLVQGLEPSPCVRHKRLQLCRVVHITG